MEMVEKDDFMCENKKVNFSKKCEFFANLACFGCTFANLAYSKFPLSKNSLQVKSYNSSPKILTMSINIFHHQVYWLSCLNIRAFAPFLCSADKAFYSHEFFEFFLPFDIALTFILFFQTVLVQFYHHGTALVRTVSNFWLWNLCGSNCCCYDQCQATGFDDVQFITAFAHIEQSLCSWESGLVRRR